MPQPHATVVDLHRELDELDRAIARRSAADQTIESAKTAHQQALHELQDATAVLEREQADVDRLTGGVSRLFGAFDRDRDATLDRERAEADQARLQLEQAQAISERAQATLTQARHDAREPLPLMRDRRNALIDRLEAALTAGGGGSPELRGLVDEVGAVKQQMAEVGEVLRLVLDTESALDQASIHLAEAHIIATARVATTDSGLYGGAWQAAEVDQAERSLREADLTASELRHRLDSSTVVIPDFDLSTANRTFDLFGGFFSELNMRDAVVAAERRTASALAEAHRLRASVEAEYETLTARSNEMRERRVALIEREAGGGSV